MVKNAAALAQALMDKGFRLVSGGTDNHLMLIDVRCRDFTGKEAEHLLDAVGITANKNTIPFDPQSPFVTSGVRMGTPAATTRGMKEAQMQDIAQAIDWALSRNDNNITKAAALVKELTTAFPLYK
ncbi:Serine hydroxymethyltransferase [bioreactor metagenome]|uniref:Serine hydroxymethyltransferase n=1 Tax=bioreactor metagenome TaxID=1076179 RepID=A0A645HKI5_9ZZZZ